MPLRDNRRGNALRVVLVGTGTGVGKTHVACAVLVAWRERARVIGLKPIETGVAAHSATRAGTPPHARRTVVADPASRPPTSGRRGGAGHHDWNPAGAAVEPSDQERLASAAGLFHVKQARPASRRMTAEPPPSAALFAFPEPISPHLAAGHAGVRIDPGAIDRWVGHHEAPVTIIETAGGLFSPLGHGSTNFELLLAIRPQAVVLVASDRLGVLHDLTATLGFAAARGGPELGIVLSTPAVRDASTGRNAAEIAALGIGRPIAVFPRAAERHPVTLVAARAVIAWIEAHARGRND